MALPEYPKKLEGLIAEELEGLNEVIYVRPDTGASFSLNMTAASILEWCDGKRSRAVIAGLLADALPVGSVPDAAGLNSDIEAILAHFVEHGLIFAHGGESARD